MKLNKVLFIGWAIDFEKKLPLFISLIDFSSEKKLEENSAINDLKKQSPEKPRKRAQLITLSSSISKST